MENILFSLAVGLGLAAACGFRVFVPMLVMSIAAQTGHLELGAGFEWIGTTPALAIFGAATVLEILGYYIPWVDNLLDSIATPAAIVAGTIVTASATADLSPVLQWSLAVIAGGGVAGTVQIGTSLTRATSTATTGGIGNPVVATGELIGSTLLAVLAILAPIIGIVLVLIFVLFSVRRILKRILTPKV